MIGDQYRVPGTDNVFVITADLGDRWEVTIRTSAGQELGGIWMPKDTLSESVRAGKLERT